MMTLLLLALSAELLSFYVLLGADFSALNWGYYIAIHLSACVFFTWRAWLLLPNGYKFPVWRSYGFLFSFSFCIPLLGMFGGGALLAAFYRPKINIPVTWEVCERASLSYLSTQLEVNRTQHYSAGALREILMHCFDPSLRLQAINFACHLSPQQAIPILQLALKDLSDDVRLFSYASLEEMEVKINASIIQLKSQLVSQKKADVAFNIAEQYWELCYLGLAESVLYSHYLDQASLYLIRANQITESATSNLLLGRIMLAQEKPEQALGHLTRAFDGGLLTQQVLPYLAEASFALGNYELTKYYIAQLQTSEHNPLQRLRECWL